MTDFSANAIQELEGKLRGELVRPADPAYDDLRSIWNAMIDRRPALIARCVGVADVAAAVAFARDHGAPLSIKGGGHNIAGLAVGDGCLMIDNSLMRGVWVDPKARVAHAQPGCLLGDVDRETQVHGLAAVLGFVSNTGIAGLTLGGGFGYLSRKYGWTSDNVLSMQVVTADGRIVRAAEDENDDLFWALRGGGGNFGVVTDFEYKLVPLGPEIMAGGIAWPMSDAPGVLEMFREFALDAPPELTCAVVLRIAPPAPWLPKEIHGKPIVAVFACHAGTVEQGRKDLAPLKGFGSPVGDIIQPRPYVTQQSMLDATQPKGRRYYWKSEYVSGFDAELVAKALEHAERLPSPHSAVILFALGGRIRSLPEDHSAVGNRETEGVLNITAAWEGAADDDANIGWARSAWEEMRSFSTGGTYINFLTEEEGADRTRDALGGNYDRLVDVKTKWDPQNLFRMNKNIEPRS